MMVVVVVFTDRQTFTKSLRRKAIYSGKTRRSPFYGDVESNMSMLIETPTTTPETFYEWLKYGETPIATWQYIYPLPPSHVPCGGGGDRPRVWCLKREPVVASLVLPAAAARRLFPVPTLPC